MKMTIKILDCTKGGGGDLDVNYGWAMQREISGNWVTVAWFRSKKDVADVSLAFANGNVINDKSS